MATHERQPQSKDRSTLPLAVGQLELSPERQEFLAPRLAALLADFSKLEALVPSDTEPAMMAELMDEVRRERD